MFFLSGVRFASLGITAARLIPNVILGCLAWFPLTLLTLGVHLLLSLLLGSETHPLTRLLKQHDFRPWEWLLIALTALAIAPVLEELVFRGILQAWLVGCSRRGHYGVIIASVFLAYALRSGREDNELSAFLFALCLLPAYLLLIHRDAFLIWDDAAQPRPWPAIFGSSLLWASFHSAIWPAPVPLFVLGMGLGWLAYRTRSLISPVIVHVLFNAVAFMVLMLES
jgi:membrane protease YdiL (CAAX protease family)